MRTRRGRPAPGPRTAFEAAAEAGAVAIEFALVLPFLVLFLFGIIQYGYGMFQLQAFNSAVADASRLASTGITSCNAFHDSVQQLVTGNGLDPAAVTNVEVHWLTATGDPTDRAVPLGLAAVTAKLRTFRIGAPFVPFPRSFTARRTVPIADIGTPGLTGCVLR